MFKSGGWVEEPMSDAMVSVCFPFWPLSLGWKIDCLELHVQTLHEVIMLS